MSGSKAKRKGKVGELEFAKLLREKLGIEARRGQQFSGNPDSPDVVHAINGVHFECKRMEQINIWRAFAQACDDCGDDLPVVVFRRNRSSWMVCFEAEQMLLFAERLNNAPRRANLQPAGNQNGQKDD